MTTKEGLGSDPQQFQALVAQLAAHADNAHDAGKAPGSPSARRFETLRQIGAQMEREGHFEFRRRSDGSVSIHMTNDGAPRRLMELMEAAGLLRDDARLATFSGRLRARPGRGSPRPPGSGRSQTSGCQRATETAVEA